MPLDTSGTATFGQTDYTRLEVSPADAPYIIEAPGVDEGANIGAAFKALREFKGMSLDEVAEATRIRRAYLASLEAFDIDALPSRPFATGYVRAYAKLLGLDPEAAVGRFKRESPDPDEVLRAPVGIRKGGEGGVSLLAGVALFIVAAVIIWNVARHAMNPQTEAANAVADAAMADASQAARAAGPLQLGPPMPAPPEATVPASYDTPGLPNADGTVNPEIPVTTINDANAPALGSAFSPRGMVYGEAGGAIVLQAVRPVSITIHTADGAVFFARFLQPGEAYRTSPVRGMIVDVSDPTVVRVYANNALKGPLKAATTPLTSLAAPVAVIARSTGAATPQSAQLTDTQAAGLVTP